MHHGAHKQENMDKMSIKIECCQPIMLLMLYFVPNKAAFRIAWTQMAARMNRKGKYRGINAWCTQGPMSIQKTVFWGMGFPLLR